MTISDKLIAQTWFRRLGRRGPNFKTMLEHVEKFSYGYIVETGTAHDQDNFEGQGQSTLIWDWFIGEAGKNIKAVSIDIRQEGIDIAKKQTKHVQYFCGDATKVLFDFKSPQDICLLYLDSMDWTPQLNLESAAQHFFELASVWALLSPGTMIVVDDRHGEMQGKHWMVEEYMKVLKIKPVFKNHQIGWIK